MSLDATLEAQLAEPTPQLVEAVGRLEGDVIVLGASGKMGPSLVGLLGRADRQARVERKIIAVARFTAEPSHRAFHDPRVRAISADLLDPTQVTALPDAPNVVFMVGQKFGTGADPGRTWALNAFLPGVIAHRYRRSRIVAFSTGNVYPLWPVGSDGPTETSPLEPIGEYAQSTLARERVLSFWSVRKGLPMALLRLNYAIEPRYGVLRDVADQVRAGRPIDLSMGAVNVIWQRDANAIALMAFGHLAVPPFVVNVTGPKVSVREIAERFGRRWGVAPRFTGTEAPTALLSNAGLANQLFGPPPTSLDVMVDLVASWIEAGGGSLGKPTHFAERAGYF